jgi:hypothetical protein
VTLGQPLGSDGELGKAIEQIATRLSGSFAPPKKSAQPAREMKPAYSQV